MRFGRRSTPAATYAALVAGRHLWLVLDTPGEVSLRGARVVAHPEPQGPHHGVRLDVADLAEGSHEVLVDGRPLRGPEVAPSPAIAPTALQRDGAGHLVVVRRGVPAGATVRALRLVGERVEVDLDLPTPSTTSTAAPAVTLVRDLALDGATTSIGPADLAGAVPGDHPVLVDGAPVRRRDDLLADPGAGALLPAVHPVGAEHALARLRWSRDATLVVRVHEARG